MFPDKVLKMAEAGFYVAVVHKKTGDYWLLNRQYQPVSKTSTLIAIPFNDEQAWKSTWDGWKPTERSQMPEWAVDIDSSEFMAYWTQD